MNKNNISQRFKNSLIIILLIIMIIISGCTRIQEKAEKEKILENLETDQETQFKYCDEKENLEERINCKDNVYLMLAKNNLETSFCDKVQGEFLSTEYCYKTVFQHKLNIKNELDFCENYQDDIKILCTNIYWQNKAVEHKDITYCEHILDETKMSECVNFTKYISKPQDLDSIAKFPQNIEDCDKVKPSLKGECEYNYWIHQVLINQDIKLCESISVNEKMVKCKSFYNKLLGTKE